MLRVNKNLVRLSVGKKIKSLMVQAAGSYTIEEEMSEDCLYLNIYTPCGQEAASHPVLFWIHGGGLVRGSGGTYFHGPEFLGMGTGQQPGLSEGM